MKRLAALGLVVLLAGCKPDAATKQAEGTDRGGAPATSRAVATPVADAGSVTGTVSFAGKAPEKVEIDVTMDPVCGMGSGTVYTEQYQVAAGKLGGVFVYVKSGPAAAMATGPFSTAPVVMDQKGCSYVPHVIGVMAGEPVEFRNSDRTMHNVHTAPTTVGNDPIDVSEGPRGAPQVKSFPKPELMMPVRCNNHPWMNAFINVSATPFFAVTGTDGTFKLTGLPPGDYVLGAVHEKLGEQTFPVTVPAKGDAKAAFTFSMK